MSNHVANTILDAARTLVDSTRERAAWDAKFYDLYLKLKAIDPDLAGEISDHTISGMIARGEGMFLLGWQMRGDPEMLFTLPNPE